MGNIPVRATISFLPTRHSLAAYKRKVSSLISISTPVTQSCFSSSGSSTTSRTTGVRASLCLTACCSGPVVLTARCVSFYSRLVSYKLLLPCRPASLSLTPVLVPPFSSSRGVNPPSPSGSTNSLPTASRSTISARPSRPTISPTFSQNGQIAKKGQTASLSPSSASAIKLGSSWLATISLFGCARWGHRSCLALLRDLAILRECRG